MRVRWLPFDPPWTVLVYLGGFVLAAVAYANRLGLLFWLAVAIAIAGGALGMERWWEGRRQRSRQATRQPS